MVKVEAVVIRERIETVIDAVEEATGHVGVTVVEAVGHGRQRGITHEYRGRVFESRFLPKALLTFLVSDEIADRVATAISDAARSGPRVGRRARLAFAGRGRRSQPHRTAARGGGDAVSNKDLLVAASTIWVVVTAVLVMFMQAGFAFLEAGLTRMKNAGHIAGKNVLIFARLLDRLLDGRVRARVRRRQRRHRHAGFFPSVNELIVGRPEAVRLVLARSRARAGYLFEVVFAGVSLAIVWGAMAERAKLWVYFVFGVYLHARSTRSRRTGSGARTAGCSSKGCRTSPARPSCTTRARSLRSPGRSCSGRGSASSAPTAGRTRSRATTSRTPCSGRSSSGSAGSASTRARRCRSTSAASATSPTSR